MADHGKNIIIGAGTTDDSYAVMETEEKEEIKPIENDGIKKPQEEEPSKGFGLNEIYEIIKENKELINTLEDMTVELKAGAVLNRKNKTDLTNAQQLIQNVLDSAETTEEGKEVDGLEIEGDKELDIKEKEYQEEKDVVDINGAKDIIKSYIDKQEEENIKYKKEQYAYFVKMAEEIPDMLIKRKIGKVI